jgi:hypothetical protein
MAGRIFMGAYLGCKNNLTKEVDSFIEINGRYTN